MHSICIKRLLASAALLAFASTAWAQYVWIDDKGTKQFSDMPPPASLPKNRILKQPGKAASVAGPAAPATPAENSAATAPASLADRNAEFNKRRAEQAEKDKKAAQEAQAARDKARNCEKARTYQRALESGQRIASTDKNGERVFMSDEQRSREVQETNRVLSDCK
jgi:flagellar biosynthesis/type III secretory pathway protein FliH